MNRRCGKLNKTYSDNNFFVVVQVQVLVLDLSSPTSFQFSIRTGLSPCVASALLFLFISYKPHFTSATK